MLARLTLTDLADETRAVIEAAQSGPVDIMSEGVRKFVVLTADEYDRLIAREGGAFHADDAPEYVAALMLAALERADD
jgi:prevent-host-death family protein